MNPIPTRGARADEPQGAKPKQSGMTRDKIQEAALEVFLRKGFEGTSIDEIVALASVSKQTVYKLFSDKQGLFVACVMRTIEGTYDRFAPALLGLQQTTRFESDLRAYARLLLAETMQPQILQLRRLMIAEANRFPELARTYYERTYERATTTMATALQVASQRGHVRIDDATMAAQHFTWLVLGAPRNRVMLRGDETQISAAELRRYADAGVSTFLAAYAP